MLTHYIMLVVNLSQNIALCQAIYVVLQTGTPRVTAIRQGHFLKGNAGISSSCSVNSITEA